uniref:tRNA-dihydrouridine synthase n=1 Tax=Globisporangium ultimum (strain ATCC 200006 / CBS 805.95 / DAOM BR144) TaxID=431595 RepID=K3X2Z5_GLOUD
MSFWSKLAKPIYCVAPMANVTDVAFRRVITDLAKPTVMWTEFVSCEALTYDTASRKRMMATLMYAEQERPVVAQLFGSKPEQFYESAMIVRDLGFDGIDINMGCPETNVNNQGSGASLILDPPLAENIIRECKRGAGDIPVSVKTRIGFHEIDYKDWVLRLLGTEPEVLTIHGRTRDEMSKVPAHWDAIGDIVNLSKSIGSSALILGNGDVKNLVEAKQKVDEYGVDGVMLGRALFGNPWLFQGHLDTSRIPVKEKLEVIRQHTKYFETLLAEPKLVGFPRMKKFYGAYLKGMPNARQVRDKFALTRTAEDVYEILDECLAYLESHDQEELQQHDEARVEEA